MFPNYVVFGASWFNINHIPTWAYDARPLHTLAKKSVVWDWSDQCQASFKSLKTACLENGILAAPDYTKPFCVGCDASDDGKGVQLVIPIERPDLERYAR